MSGQLFAVKGPGDSFYFINPAGVIGMYQVGEVDFGISGSLDEYLERHGERGKNDIIKTLDYLKEQVEEKWQTIKPHPPAALTPELQEEDLKVLRYERSRSPMAEEVRKKLENR